MHAGVDTDGHVYNIEMGGGINHFLKVWQLFKNNNLVGSKIQKYQLSTVAKKWFTKFDK